MITIRTRSVTWFAAGAAIMLITVVAFQALRSTAAGPAGQSVFVPTEPCRLFDYRPAPDTVGTRTTPLGPNETHTQQVTGKVGNCDVPAGASAIAMNVTAVSPTAQSNLRLFPADQVTPPLVSNLNYSAGQKPVPNKVDVKLSPTGAIKLLNFRGDVFVIGDMVGYYISSPLTDLEAKVAALEADKATQDARIAALEAANAAQDASINLNGDVASQNQTKVDSILADTHVIPSGTTVVGEGSWTYDGTTDDHFIRFDVQLPGRAPVALTDGTVNFSLDALALDDDAFCNLGTAVPMAPPGRVCIYVVDSGEIDGLSGHAALDVQDRSFAIELFTNMPMNNSFLDYKWAYTAP